MGMGTNRTPQGEAWGADGVGYIRITSSLPFVQVYAESTEIYGHPIPKPSSPYQYVLPLVGFDL
jgi:hypothetical protein